MVKLNIPSVLFIGDRITWADSDLSGVDPLTGATVRYAPSTHTLKYSLRGSTQLDVTATAHPTKPDIYLLDIPSISSVNLSSGIYLWQASVLLGADRTTLGTGQVQATNNLAAISTNLDARSSAQKMLEQVEAAIQARLSGGAVSSYSIKNRSASFYSLEELYKMRSRLKLEVSRASGNADADTILTQFSRP